METNPFYSIKELLNSYGLIRIMQDSLCSAIKIFFSEIQPEPKRVFHGRGQLFPEYSHVCLDWYPPVVFVSAYEPIGNLVELLAWLRKMDKPCQIQTIMLQKRYEKNSPAELLYGEDKTRVIVEENGLKFETLLGKQQNTGLFLDMQPLRVWLKGNSAGKKLLNLFSYTCTLSVAALAGGARSAVNVDLSKTSMRWGERNHDLNGQDKDTITSLPFNVFTSWGRIKQEGRYDLVIIDPPTYQRNSFSAERDYGAVLKKMHSLCSDEATIIAALNSPFLDEQFLLDKFERHVPKAKFVELMAAAPEFLDRFPERALKIFRFEFSSE